MRTVVRSSRALLVGASPEVWPSLDEKYVGRINVKNRVE